MNVIQHTINTATRYIPRMILEDAFIRHDSISRTLPVSLEYRIREEVVNAIVLPDLNVTCGSIVKVPLNHQFVQRNQIDNLSAIYHIPKEITSGRSIMSVFEVGIANYGYSYGSFCGNTELNRATHSLLNSINIPPQSTSARVELIGENTVLVKNLAYTTGNLYLECMLENDEELSHIKPRFIPTLSKLIEYAIKAYIYNKLHLRVDQAELVGGHSLGEYRTIIDSYSEARDLYDDLMREKGRKLMFSNNHDSVNKLIRFQLMKP